MGNPIESSQPIKSDQLPPIIFKKTSEVAVFKIGAISKTTSMGVTTQPSTAVSKDRFLVFFGLQGSHLRHPWGHDPPNGEPYRKLAASQIKSTAAIIFFKNYRKNPWGHDPPQIPMGSPIENRRRSVIQNLPTTPSVGVPIQRCFVFVFCFSGSFCRRKRTGKSGGGEVGAGGRFAEAARQTQRHGQLVAAAAVVRQQRRQIVEHKVRRLEPHARRRRRRR